jgi:hypothetical protein
MSITRDFTAPWAGPPQIVALQHLPHCVRPSCTSTRSRPELAQRGPRHTPHVATLHVVALHVVALHGYSFSSCCRTRTRLGLAASQVPPRPPSPSYRRARPCCPPCGSAPSRHALAPSAHARIARASLACTTPIAAAFLLLARHHATPVAPPALASRACTASRAALRQRLLVSMRPRSRAPVPALRHASASAPRLCPTLAPRLPARTPPAPVRAQTEPRPRHALRTLVRALRSASAQPLLHLRAPGLRSEPQPRLHPAPARSAQRPLRPQLRSWARQPTRHLAAPRPSRCRQPPASARARPRSPARLLRRAARRSGRAAPCTCAEPPRAASCPAR